MNYYAAKDTVKFLAKKQKKVYLYGSNMGYANFGDIIQLKNEIKFHKNETGLEPVVMLRLEAPFGGAKHEQNQKWYGTQHFVYMTGEDRGKKAFDGLQRVKKARPGAPLHVYGGGFLNGFWGKDMVGEIRHILEDLEVGEYVFSGQQVAESVLPELQALFDYKQPALFGLRDKQSLTTLRGGLPEVNSLYSFDDVTEILTEWLGGQKVKQGKNAANVAWHFNTTNYVAEGLANVRDKMTAVSAKYKGSTHTMLQAYNDKTYQAKDSLQSIVEMEVELPFTSYHVVNIGQMALEMDANKGNYPEIGELLTGTKIAVTSSYHTAMVMNYLGVPAFLMAANDYYAQKQQGLGYSPDFGAFLADPSINLKTFAKEREERDAWLKILRGFFVGLG